MDAHRARSYGREALPGRGEPLPELAAAADHLVGGKEELGDGTGQRRLVGVCQAVSEADEHGAQKRFAQLLVHPPDKRPVACEVHEHGASRRLQLSTSS